MSPSSWDDNKDYNNSSIHESTRSNLLNDSARKDYLNIGSMFFLCALTYRNRPIQRNLDK